jgi:hypothetical protein
MAQHGTKGMLLDSLRLVISDQPVRQDLRHATTLFGKRGHDLPATFVDGEESAGDADEENQAAGEDN